MANHSRGVSKLIRWSDDPVLARKVHGWATLFWIAMAVPSMLLWSQSVPYLVGISVYAVVAGHWSGYQAAGAEVKVDVQADDVEVNHADQVVQGET